MPRTPILALRAPPIRFTGRFGSLPWLFPQNMSPDATSLARGLSVRTCAPAGLPLSRLAFPTGTAPSVLSVLRRFAPRVRLRRPRLAAWPWTVSLTGYRFVHQPMFSDLAAEPHPDTPGDPQLGTDPDKQVSLTGLTEPWTSAGLR